MHRSHAQALTISVVIPAFNESARIVDTLRSTLNYLAMNYTSSEVIVVDDGSTDDTSGVIRRCFQSPRVRLLRFERNQGKGAAVKHGVLQAYGQQVLIMDADLATPLIELQRLGQRLAMGAELAIASRRLPTSAVVQPGHRAYLGRGFNALVRALLPCAYADTQCGFKLLRRQAARTLFERITLAGYAYDVELLCLADIHRFDVAEVAVRWQHVPGSKVASFREAFRMARDVLRLRGLIQSARQQKSMLGWSLVPKC